MGKQVDLDHLVGVYEAAWVLKLSPTRVRQLIRAGDFPEPVLPLKMGDIWLVSDILEWERTRVKKAPGRPKGPRKGPDVSQEL